jgi:hypothetical protein
MSYTKTQGKTLNQAENRYSNGTELIPAEVQAHVRHDETQSIDIPFVVGYTIDDEAAFGISWENGCKRGLLLQFPRTISFLLRPVLS